VLDAAVTAHANYQQQNNLITHEQDDRGSGYTGEKSPDRLPPLSCRCSLCVLVANIARDLLAASMIARLPCNGHSPHNDQSASNQGATINEFSAVQLQIQGRQTLR